MPRDSMLRCLRQVGTAIAIVLLFLPIGLPAQHRSHPATYSSDQLLGDFAVFEAAVREAHGGLHVYRTPEEIDQVFAEARKGLENAQTEIELHRTMLWVVAQIKDGHTSAMLSGAQLEYMYRQPAFFPFRFAFVDGKAILHLDFSEDAQALIGAELVALNGRPMRDVLETILAHIPGDGNAHSGQYFRLTDAVTFGRLYQVMFGPVDTFEAHVIPLGQADTLAVTLPAIDHATHDRRLEARYPERWGTPHLALSYPEGVPGTAVMRVSGFYGSGFTAFIDEAFEAFETKGVEHLVLDLRGNGGGLENYGQHLFAYLAEAPFSFYERVTVNARTFKSYDYSSNSATVYNEAEAFATDDGRFQLTKTRRDFLDIQQPAEPHFGGSVIVLIDGGSFSTTADLCAAIDQHTNAVFIGEETGGSYSGNTSGNRMTIHLPHTKARANLPLERYDNVVQAMSDATRGVLPDFPVMPGREDLAAGVDAVMMAALEMIKESAAD